MSAFEIPDKYKHLDWQDIAAQLCDAICGGKSRVHIMNLDKQNAINSTGNAVFMSENGEDEIVDFCFRNGDWNGTEIYNIGYSEKYNPPTPTRKIFAVDQSLLETKEKVKNAEIIFEHWKTTDWFKKKESNMNYDMFFDPSNKTVQHYRDFAKSKGMKIITVEQPITSGERAE